MLTHRPGARAEARRLSAALSLLVALSAGCSASEPAAPDAADSSPSASGDVTVIQPGKPGEEASTVGPDAVEPDSFNDADQAFMQMMIPHHGQALVMARLAPKRAASARVRTLAERIEAAQGPEIVAMAAWLENRDLPVPRAAEDPNEWDHANHGHDGMRGMLSPAALADLRAAKGAEFDRLFLQGMIRHHEGAITMAADAGRDGEDRLVQELAADISVGQRAEITRMRTLLG